MEAKREYRSRNETEVAVLDALVDRREEGMTVFELRSRADVNIDHLEEALANLKEANLITAETDGERTLIFPEDRVVPDPGAGGAEEPSLLDRIRERLGV